VEDMTDTLGQVKTFLKDFERTDNHTS
jgi:hypothetical protein